MAPSQEVIKHRLKNGECIHCGIQTHKIVKKMFGKNQKVALNIPGSVEHGRCMLASCQQAGNNVTTDDSIKKPNRISGQAVGVVASVGGAVMTGLGIPGGEVLSSVGQAVASSSQSQPGFSNSSVSSSYEQIMQQAQAQPNSSASIFEQIMKQTQAQANISAAIMQQAQAQAQPNSSASIFEQIMKQTQAQADISATIMQQAQAQPNSSASIFEQIMKQTQAQANMSAMIMQQAQAQPNSSASIYEQIMKQTQTQANSSYEQIFQQAFEQSQQQYNQAYAQMLNSFNQTTTAPFSGRAVVGDPSQSFPTNHIAP